MGSAARSRIVLLGRKAHSESDTELKPETMMGDGNRVAAVE